LFLDWLHTDGQMVNTENARRNPDKSRQAWRKIKKRRVQDSDGGARECGDIQAAPVRDKLTALQGLMGLSAGAMKYSAV
jgi:hypothetical protein